MLDKWQWKNSLNYSQSRHCSGSCASTQHVMVHPEIHAYKIQSPLCSHQFWENLKVLIIPHCKLRNKTGALRPLLQHTDCKVQGVKRGREDVREWQQVQAWGITKCKGSPVRSSVDSGANVMLVVAPDVPISIYGLLAPATSLLSFSSFHEGQFRRRRDRSPRWVHTLTCCLVKPLASAGIWCVGGRKWCGKKEGFKVATFPLGTRQNLPAGSAQTSSLLSCKGNFQIVCNSHQWKGPTQIQTRSSQKRRLTP